MKSRLMFTLCPSSSFCSVFPSFQFPSKTNFFATLSFLNAFSRLLPHTPLSKKNSPPLKILLFFLSKNENPLPAFTCSLFIPSCKSSPVPAINQSPSSTTTMARWWCLWPHVPACSTPPETSPHSSKTDMERMCPKETPFVNYMSILGVGCPTT